jgi:uncharacterized protein (DUF952 family)
MDNQRKNMTLVDNLLNIKHRIERDLSITLADGDFKDSWEEITHIYLREACHAAIDHCVPWVRILPEGEHTAVDEIMARLLVMEFGASLDLCVRSDQEFLDELNRYQVVRSEEIFQHLKNVWQGFFWPRRDLAGMATYLLSLLRYGRLVYHILPMEDWQKALHEGFYAPRSLETEGFIHCSEVDQVLHSAEAYFGGQRDLLLLCIALDKVLPVVRYEGGTAGNAKGFPHIYGPLRLSAVVNISVLSVDQNGDFALPQYPDALAEFGRES